MERGLGGLRLDDLADGYLGPLANTFKIVIHKIVRAPARCN
jgi:hypothetical protein